MLVPRMDQQICRLRFSQCTLANQKLLIQCTLANVKILLASAEWLKKKLFSQSKLANIKIPFSQCILDNQKPAYPVYTG